MRGDPPSLLLKLLVQSSRTLAVCSRSCHLARDAQPINLRDRTHAATPEKFGAWPDKLVCLRPTFFFFFSAEVVAFLSPKCFAMQHYCL